MLSGAGPRTPRTAFLGFSLTHVKRFFILKCAHPHHTSFSLPTAHLYPHPDPLEASSLRGSSFLLIEIHSLIGSIKNFHVISPQIHVSFLAPHTIKQSRGVLGGNHATRECAATVYAARTEPRDRHAEQGIMLPSTQGMHPKQVIAEQKSSDAAHRECDPSMRRADIGCLGAHQHSPRCASSGLNALKRW